MEEDERRKRRQAVTLKLFLGAIVVSQHSRAAVGVDRSSAHLRSNYLWIAVSEICNFSGLDW